MAELGPGDLPASTRALFADDAAAQAAIDAALAAARRWCGWYVSPVQTGVAMDVDGPGGTVLSLPTLNLISLTALTENGKTVDVTQLRVSRRKGVVSKKSGWWTSHFGGIEAIVTHGFTEAEAADWRQAVVQMVAMWARTSIRESADMKRKRVDDVDYEWYEGLISTDQQLASKFSAFRILPLA
jgi:hypothetical protein